MDEPGADPAARARAGWLVPGGLMLLLGFLTADVLARGLLSGVDERVRAAVQARATSPGLRWLAAGRLAPAQLITDLGVAKVAVPILVVCALAAALRLGSLRPLAIAAGGLALLAATVIPAKILIGRPGPGYAVLPRGSWGDFPSGHACTAGVCYGLAVLLASSAAAAAGPGQAQLARRLRRAGLAAAAAVCFLVGVALVWCDYHWLTDVIAGWALAALIVWAVWRVQGRMTAAGGAPAAPDGGTGQSGGARQGSGTGHSSGTERRSTPDDRARA